MFGLGQYWTKKQYNALDCQLNEETLQFKKGVLFAVEKTIPLENIQDLTFKEGPILRLFGLSILEIETDGGQGNRTGGDLTLIGIIEAKAFREKVLAQRKLLKQSSANESITPKGDTAILEEISQTLKNIEKNLKNS
ncbi:PH domain-containing protein [Salibacteraceae bacterium]|nr:PH domain-containing protein [Salibacteraceae bacterium]MDB0058102.1 PH domain-containing protein [Salibacteraceae bacterium]MDC1204952.1 PH domain-containing protein [Salibacteraceae bacterium]